MLPPVCIHYETIKTEYIPIKKSINFVEKEVTVTQPNGAEQKVKVNKKINYDQRTRNAIESAKAKLS